MRHRLGKRKLGRPTDHREALLKNLVTDLLRYEKIKTTEAKAKALRSEAEKVITWAKLGNLHARRLALSKTYEPAVVDKLFDELAPRFRERAGGYTRIVRLGFRKGDGAPMAQIELVL